MIPTMPTGTVYNERRFIGELQHPGFSIISTNGHFPPEEQTASFGEKVNQAAINVPKHKRRLWIKWILISSVIISFPLVMWYSHKNGYRQNN